MWPIQSVPTRVWILEQKHRSNTFMPVSYQRESVFYCVSVQMFQQILKSFNSISFLKTRVNKTLQQRCWFLFPRLNLSKIQTRYKLRQREFSALLFQLKEGQLIINAVVSPASWCICVVFHSWKKYSFQSTPPSAIWRSNKVMRLAGCPHSN